MATDYCTRYVIAQAISDETANTVAQFIIRKIVCLHGAPQRILTDSGKAFRSKLIVELCQQLRAKHVFSTHYHPQTNGLVERMNRTIATMLSMYIGTKHDDWDNYLPYVIFAYNVSIHASTGCSPFYLLFGRNATLPVDISLKISSKTEPDFTKELRETREIAKSVLVRQQATMKKNYDKLPTKIKEFEVGEEVMVYTPRGYSGKTTKLLHFF